MPKIKRRRSSLLQKSLSSSFRVALRLPEMTFSSGIQELYKNLKRKLFEAEIRHIENNLFLLLFEKCK